MSDTNDISSLATLEDYDMLSEGELDVVTGGAVNHSEFKIVKYMDSASPGDPGISGGTGGGATPAGAWNACLGVFGYPPQA